MPNEEPKYGVYGYDKDSDVYELICACPNIARACEMASILAARKTETRRFPSGEPFDWFTACRSLDPYDQHKIFDANHIDGFVPVF